MAAPGRSRTVTAGTVGRSARAEEQSGGPLGIRRSPTMLDAMRRQTRTSRTRFSILASIIVLTALIAPGNARAQSHLAAWGEISFDSRLTNQTFVDVAAGYGHTLARRSDGSVVELGREQFRRVQRSSAPAGRHVRRDRGARDAPRSRAGATGIVVAFGPERRGPVQRPSSLPGSPTSRSPPAISHTLARRSDGSVVAWGQNTHGECNVPPLLSGLTYVEVAAGLRPTPSRAEATAPSSPGD